MAHETRGSKRGAAGLRLGKKELTFSTTHQNPPHTQTPPPPYTATMTMPVTNYRLIDIDALDPESAFPAELLTPQFTPVSTPEIQSLAGACRQQLQRGDQEGALVAALEGAPYGGDEQGKVCAPPWRYGGEVEQKLTDEVGSPLADGPGNTLVHQGC